MRLGKVLVFVFFFFSFSFFLGGGLFACPLARFWHCSCWCWWLFTSSPPSPLPRGSGLSLEQSIGSVRFPVMRLRETHTEHDYHTQCTPPLRLPVSDFSSDCCFVDLPFSLLMKRDLHSADYLTLPCSLPSNVYTFHCWSCVRLYLGTCITLSLVICSQFSEKA